MESHAFSQPGTYTVEVESRYCRNRADFDDCPPGQNRSHGSAQIEIEVLADENAVLTANGESDSVTVGVGEEVAFEANVFNCSGVDPDAWRERWIFADGEVQTDGPFVDNPCDFSPLSTTHEYDSPGEYEAEFVSEFCMEFDNAVCQSGWQEHGRDDVLVVVPAFDGDPVVDYRMEEPEWDGSSGEVRDSSGNENHATGFGGADTDDVEPVRSGDPGTCRYAEVPRGGRISAPAPSELNTPNEFSIAFWFRARDIQNEDSVIALGDLSGVYATPVEVLRSGAGSLRVVITSEDGSESVLDYDSSPFSGEWVHLAVTREIQSGPGANQTVIERLFFNGAEAASNDLSDDQHPDLAFADQIHIGGLPGEFSGAADYDDVVFLGQALTEDELDELRLRDLPCPGEDLDHVRISHPQSGLTCSPSEIGIQACADEDCSELFPEEVEVSLTSPDGNWSDNPISFTGSTTVGLQVTQEGTVGLAAEATSHTAANPNQCFIGGTQSNCEMDIFRAGFVIDAPNHVSDESVTALVAAVREDDETEQCVPGFSNESRSVGFAQGFSNPDNGQLPVILNDEPLAVGGGFSPVTLDFDGDGVAEMSLQYADVGEIRLEALYEGSGDMEDGLVMVGDARFIARPDHFTVTAIGDDMRIPDDSGASGPEGAIFATAGEPFFLEVQARNLSGDVTPNFGQEQAAEGVDLELSLIQPDGGESPPLTGDLEAFGNDCEGDENLGVACGEFTWAEVGVIQLSPSLSSGDYLGMGGDGDVQGETTGNIGRFVPAYYHVSHTQPELAAACTANQPYNYLTQPMRFSTNPQLTVAARNALGEQISNAEAAWWRFSDLDGVSSTNSGDFRYRDCQIENDDDFEDCEQLNEAMDALAIDAGALRLDIDINDSVNAGIGQLEIGDNGVGFGHRWTSDGGAPEVTPFVADYRAQVRIVDQDGIPFRRFDGDGNVESETWYEFSWPVEENAEQRHGRLRIANAHGSERLDLATRVVVEYYHGNDGEDAYWQINTDDDCSDDVTLAVEPITAPTAAVLIEDGDGCGTPSGDKQWRTTAMAGDFNAWFQCTNELGSHRVTADELPEWLRYDWSGSGDGHEDAPEGTITFGIHRGPDNRIDLREVIR